MDKLCFQYNQMKYNVVNTQVGLLNKYHLSQFTYVNFPISICIPNYRLSEQQRRLMYSQ